MPPLRRVPDNVLITLNVSLSLISMLLLLALVGVQLPSFGKVIDVLNSQQPVCQVVWQGEFQDMPLDSCCLEARKQLECHLEEKNWVCETGSSHALRYSLNTKAYQYCQQQVIWR